MRRLLLALVLPFAACASEPREEGVQGQTCTVTREGLVLTVEVPDERISIALPVKADGALAPFGLYWTDGASAAVCEDTGLLCDQ